MDPIVLTSALFFSACVGYWANSWGRNGWGWGIAALICSPILTAIVLLIAGKTVEVKAKEAAIINSTSNK